MTDAAADVAAAYFGKITSIRVTFDPRPLTSGS